MKVLMVCLGNICRSPIAEGILQDIIDKKKLEWEVDSAGTIDYHQGKPPHQESIEVAIKYGIDISHQRSRIFDIHDYDKFDIIIAMDSSNYQDLIRMARNTSDKSKVKIMLNYAYPKLNKAVPDLYYEGGFDNVYNQLKVAVDALVKMEEKS